MAASINDVARRANVSISTVSRVLNRRNVVNRDTRKRVEAAIEELGYRPNVFARGLMLRKSNILGLVLPDLHGEFYSEVIHGAQLKARELGYHLLVSSVAADEDGRDVLAAVTSQGLVDGLAVMVTDRGSRIRASLADLRRPLVILDGDIRGVDHDTVAIDHRRGAEALVHRLVDRHPGRRFAFLGGHKTNLDTIDRLKAFRKVLAEASHELDESDVAYLDYTYETALEFASDRIKAWERNPTAVFAANDEMAAGVIDAATRAGLHVPGDLPVVGFDDTRIAQLTRPRLTTVRMPMAEMGSTAIDLLYKRLTDSGRPSTRVKLSTELILRDSCGCA